MTSSLHPTPTPPLDCTAVDACLADYLDDEPPTALDAHARAAVDRHVATCARCRTLVRDLRAVTAAAADLPTLAPSRDLWAGIDARLAPRAPAAPPRADDAPPRVLPFEVHRVRHAPPAAAPRGAAHVAGPRPGQVTWSRRWLAAAAVALVTVSAGTTYVATRAATGSAPATVATGPASQAPATTTAGPADGATPDAASGPTADPTIAAGVAGADDTGRTGADAAEPATPRMAGGSAARLVARRTTPAPDAAVPAAAAYDREIAALRAVVRERRGELDSATVNVLVRNLGIIDAAIAQSRAALARDPHSQFLGDQLTRALGQKVELLRTVALMPRT